MITYYQNINYYAGLIQQLEKALKRLSILRALSFLISLLAIGILANERLLVCIWIAAPFCTIVFFTLLVRYNQLNQRRKNANTLKQINEEELLRLENKLESFPTGDTYQGETHPYVADLDVFGSHSLFQLINRTTTETGSDCLASWFSQTASSKIIIERQQAIRELNPDLEWRQKLQAAGLPFQNLNSDYQKLVLWFDKQELLLPKQKYYLTSIIILALSSTILFIMYVGNSFVNSLNLYLIPLLLVLLINRLILRKVAPVAEEIIDLTNDNIKTLFGYKKLVEAILTKTFQSKRLNQLQSLLTQNKSSAPLEIGKLNKILDSFQLRGTKKSEGNKFYPLLNTFWLLDIYWIIMAERWKRKNRSQIHDWINSISEFEALNSLAGFAYANPDYTFPDVKEAPFIIDFEMIGHPLIKSEDRICNSFQLVGAGKITMITGSNMAGKSTFLRSVGVNLVLALMGAPCCAKSGQVSPMEMFTSMRTKDNLEAGVSSFYAELKRVEQLLKLINRGVPIFFMLDEMFKGTNSKDRYRGGVSLIKQLSELNAFGIISTHDLELANLAGKNMIVTNQSFNSKIIDGELMFDYKLTDGVCIDFNASELMKRSGINILNNFEKL